MGGMISAWRSMGQDPSVLKQKVKPGTAKRTIAFALPYTGLLTVFLLVVIVDASITSLSARSFSCPSLFSRRASGGANSRPSPKPLTLPAI